MLASGTAEPQKQDESQATYCGKIDKNISCIDWNSSAREIHNLVRGLNPRPVAWTTFRGKNIKLWKTSKSAVVIRLKVISMVQGIIVLI